MLDSYLLTLCHVTVISIFIAFIILFIAALLEEVEYYDYFTKEKILDLYNNASHILFTILVLIVLVSWLPVLISLFILGGLIYGIFTLILLLKRRENDDREHLYRDG